MDIQEAVPASAPLPLLNQPTVLASGTAIRIQQGIALAVVVVPFLGFVAALLLVRSAGMSRQEMELFVASYFFGMLGITLGFHRHFAHRAFKTSRGMQIFFAILGSMAAQGPLFFWVATHRRHHTYSDQPEDPHSPQLCGQGFWESVKGFWHGHIGWMFSREQTNWAKFVPDLIKDRLLFRMHRLYPVWVFLGLAIPTLVGGIGMGTWGGALRGFLWGGLTRIFFVNQALWCVGSICHMFGRRPFQHRTLDHSANNYWVALVTFGEGNQNDHHAFPNSARHGLNWWQPDFTADVIVFLEKIGLVWDVKIPKKNTVLAALEQR